MSAVLSVTEQTLRLCHIMLHADGRIAATQTETVEHIYLRNHKPFHWPSRLLKNAQGFSAKCPDAPPQPAMARNIDTTMTLQGHDRETLEGYGVTAIGAGVLTKDEMNAAGFATPEAMFGRSTSTVGWFGQGWPELYDADYMAAQGSAAVLEIYAIFHTDMRQGDSYEYRAGIISVDSYTRTFLYSFNDAVTGACLSSYIVNGCLFSLKTRKLTKSTPEQLALIAPHINAALLPKSQS